MAVRTQHAAGVRRTPEEIRADYQQVEARREALRLQHSALQDFIRREHAQVAALEAAMRTCDRTIDMLIMEAAAPVLWP